MRASYPCPYCRKVNIVEDPAGVRSFGCGSCRREVSVTRHVHSWQLSRAGVILVSAIIAVMVILMLLGVH
jgi:hypothetical protein